MSDTEEPREGWRIEAWAKVVGISRTTVYDLMSRGDLRWAKVGKARIIMESPRNFLERHAPLQASDC